VYLNGTEVYRYGSKTVSPSTTTTYTLTATDGDYRVSDSETVTVTGSSSGGGSPTSGVSVQVGEQETAVDLTVAIEYGVSIPQVTETVRRNVINRIENLTGLGVTEVNITVNDVQFPEERPQLEQQQEVEQQAHKHEQRA
jgi:uncharacterized alkaline shock family protein YloU